VSLLVRIALPFTRGPTPAGPDSFPRPTDTRPTAHTDDEEWFDGMDVLISMAVRITEDRRLHGSLPYRR
jgi:hypothetical protein